jgi:hypothetical protein
MEPVWHKFTVGHFSEYVGSSTKSEIEYAKMMGKPVKYLE